NGLRGIAKLLSLKRWARPKIDASLTADRRPFVDSTSGYIRAKSRHLFHRRSDQQRHSLLEQSVCFTFHLIAIAVRRPCLQPVETDRVDASSGLVPNFVAAEILVPGDNCRLKIAAAMDRPPRHIVLHSCGLRLSSCPDVSHTICSTSDPTGKNQVVNDMENLV